MIEKHSCRLENDGIYAGKHRRKPVTMDWTICTDTFVGYPIWNRIIVAVSATNGEA